MRITKNVKILLFFSFISLLLIAVSAGESKCECLHEEDEGNKAGATKYKIAAIPSVLVAGVIGVLLPLLGNFFPSLKPETNFFFVTKAFAAGVILATGFMHVLPEGYEKLTDPSILTLSVDSFATSYFHRLHNKTSKKIGDGEEQIGGGGGGGGGGGDELGLHVHAHGHAHGIVGVDSGDSEVQLHRTRVVAQVLEVGIIVHSVVIGISLGASQSPDTAKALFAALMFHQCFEGLGLGGCIAQGKFNCMSITIMSIFFSVTTPIGIAVGMGIASSYNESSQTALIVQGVLNAASAGILIYMSLVDFLAADFMHPKMQSNTGLRIMAHISLLIGAGIMSLLAKWA
ncbi:Zinc transporter 5 [Raphanus sativus]|nr:Zinc transporter 5 [Raphanus sativus]